MTLISQEAIRAMGNYKHVSLDGINAEAAIELYRFMIRLRKCEQALIDEYHPADEMRCPVHFCLGQEAVPAALSLSLADDDYLFSHHRSHGFFLAKHAPLNALFAEIYGRETGANQGYAGSQDISMPSHKFYSGAILAGSIAIATGTALACQLTNNSRVVVAGFGEAATDEGVFWESLNYAALRQLPVVFICENNGYATYSPQLKRSPSDNISQKVATFGVESHSLFGNDAISVHANISNAIEHAREGRGPVFIEAYTYRWNGHVGPEDDDYLNYRSKDEIEFWRAQCPIKLLEKSMLSKGMLDANSISSILHQADIDISAAFQFAKSSAFPIKTEWDNLHYSASSPMADRLLQEFTAGVFNQNQSDAIPKPY